MTAPAVAVGSRQGHVADLLDAYREHLASVVAVDQGSRAARLRAARRFLGEHPDQRAWMGRPLPARLADLHRTKAWPFLSWCLVEGWLRPDLELLLGKPGGSGLPSAWAAGCPGDVERLAQAGRDLGWSENWVRQVSLLAACTLCLHAGVGLADLRDEHFTDLLDELERARHVSVSARAKLRTRCFSLRQACYQLRIIVHPPRPGGPVARGPAELAAAITQPEIRREVVRYVTTLLTSLKPGTVAARTNESPRVLWRL